MKFKLALLAGAGMAFSALPALATPCADLLPGAAAPSGVVSHAAAQAASGAKREIEPLDLARLRQIGDPESYFAVHPALSISPDGAQVAFVIQQADPASNSYCIGLGILDLATGRPPRLLASGGELILSQNAFHGSIWKIGYPALVRPQWSPDGQSIAWLRRERGSTQVWVVGAAGGAPRQLSDAPADVEQFAWRSDGEAVVFAARSGQVAEADGLAREERNGFHYDDRYAPTLSSRPMPSASIPLRAYIAEIGGGAQRVASSEEASALPPDEMGTFPSIPARVSASGWRAEMQHMTEHPSSPAVLTALSPAGTRLRCGDPACSGRMVDMWWDSRGRRLYFLRREGWANGDTALYSWNPGARTLRRMVRTSDLISNCVQAVLRLVCLRETATAPQRLVEIELGNGRIHDLYDPNPEFRSIAFGNVQRLQWRNDMGDEVRGDLVLPPGFRPGTRVPLIVTTYASNGFLRGAVGDEYPIHVFAARGFAVLSYEQPVRSAAKLAKLKDYYAAAKDGTLGWTDRWRKQTAVMNGVQLVVDMGIADPARLGISGFSDGGSTVAFALVNSSRFAAAATSSCCLEPWSIDAETGPAFARQMHQLGWPSEAADNRAFWATGSMIQNAGRINTPLLMQLSDREYQLALNVYAALKEHDKPVDMYVFPDAWHFKFQPAQRLAVYQRNLDWFAFWLQDKIDPDPAKAGQYAEWQKLRDARSARVSRR